MVWFALAAIGLVAVWTAASWFMVAGLEQAPYQIVEKRPGFEIRDYPAIAVAETRVDDVGFSANGTAFRRLAGYIFGGNSADRTIAMTAPVFIARQGSATGMSFVLPKTVSTEAAPAPKSETVDVTERPPGRYAVRRFSWFAGPKRQDAEAAKLRAALAKAGITGAGPPVYAAYNPPMSIPFMKRHEILIRVAE